VFRGGTDTISSGGIPSVTVISSGGTEDQQLLDKLSGIRGWRLLR
jgi:hypothetical protein